MENFQWEIFDSINNACNVTAAVGFAAFSRYALYGTHTLQLLLNKGISESGLEVVLHKSQKIVGHFKHSPANVAELKLQQSQMKMTEEVLIQDVPTRWNSTLQMT